MFLHESRCQFSMSIYFQRCVIDEMIQRAQTQHLRIDCKLWLYQITGTAAGKGVPETTLGHKDFVFWPEVCR